MGTAQIALLKVLTPRREISRGLGLGAGALIAGLIFLFWCVITYGGLVDTTFCPPPHRVLLALWKVLADGSLFKHAWSSLVVINLGFFLSSLIAIPLGIMMGSFRIVAAALDPVVNFIRYLPVTSMIPLLILWIGIGLEEKVAVIFIGTFFQQIVMFADVSAQVPDELFNAGYTLGASRRQVVMKVLLPATLPGVMDACAYHGLGLDLSRRGRTRRLKFRPRYMSMQAMRGLHADLIFVAILGIGFLGMVTDQIFKWIKAVWLPWAGQR